MFCTWHPGAMSSIRICNGVRSRPPALRPAAFHKPIGRQMLCPVNSACDSWVINDSNEKKVTIYDKRFMIG